MAIATLIGYIFFIWLTLLAATQALLPFETFGQRAAFISTKHCVNCSLAIFAFSVTREYLAGVWLLFAIVGGASALAYLTVYGLLKKQTPNLMKMIEPHRPLWAVLSVFYLIQTGIWFLTLGIPSLG